MQNKYHLFKSKFSKGKLVIDQLCDDKIIDRDENNLPIVLDFSEDEFAPRVVKVTISAGGERHCFTFEKTRRAPEINDQTWGDDIQSVSKFEPKETTPAELGNKEPTGERAMKFESFVREALDEKFYWAVVTTQGGEIKSVMTDESRAWDLADKLQDISHAQGRNKGFHVRVASKEEYDEWIGRG